MKAISLVTAILAMLGTALSTVTMWVFSAAALANASEASIQRVKHWVIGFSTNSLVCIGLGIWLLCIKKPGWSAMVSILPAVVMGGVFVYKIAFT